MRQISGGIFVSVLLFLSSCHGQSTKAGEDAIKLADQIKEKTNIPGVPPDEHIHMTATVDGKSWTADHLMPDRSTGSNEYRVQAAGNGISIGFYVYTPHLKIGSEERFGESNAVDLIFDDRSGFYGGRKGRFVVTKVDDDGFEGNFYFTATTSGGPGTVEVKDGTLRFPWPKRK